MGVGISLIRQNLTRVGAYEQIFNIKNTATSLTKLCIPLNVEEGLNFFFFFFFLINSIHLKLRVFVVRCDFGSFLAPHFAVRFS